MPAATPPGEIELSIVIPAYREGAKIEHDIRDAEQFLRERFDERGEICLVDDGSPDDTAARARALAQEIPMLRVLGHAPNRGKGFALRAGIAASRGRLVLCADAGSCVPYADAIAGLDLLRRGIPLAHGSRRTAGAVIERRQPRHRRWGSRVFGVLVRRCMGVPRHLRDTQCGFKIYHGATARALFGACFTDGFMLDIELIRRAHREGLQIREFPVHWHNDADTRYRPLRGTLRNLRELIRIRLHT